MAISDAAMKVGTRPPIAGPVDLSTAADRAVAPVEQQWPQSGWSRPDLVTRAGELLVGPIDKYKHTHRAISVDRLPAWIETWPDDTWQQRWVASGAELQRKAARRVGWRKRCIGLW
jgi:hypothetical protein